jgi:hypothetical protein
MEKFFRKVDMYDIIEAIASKKLKSQGSVF